MLITIILETKVLCAKPVVPPMKNTFIKIDKSIMCNKEKGESQHRLSPFSFVRLGLKLIDDFVVLPQLECCAEQQQINK